jgi:hypothetical protein
MKRLNDEQLNRLKKVGLRLATVLLIGVAYLIFVLIFKKAIPCVFYLLFHKYCPGCGITRMCVDLAQLNFKEAMGHNLLVFCLLPFLAAIALYRTIVYIKNGESKMSKWESCFYILAFILAIAFTVMRNMPQYAFLAP